MEYENASENTYQEVLLTAYLPERTAYVEGSAIYLGFSPPVYNASLRRLEWNLGSVMPGRKGKAVFEVEVDSCVPEDMEAIIARAQILVSGKPLDEKEANPVIIETLELNKKVQEKQAYKGDLLHYTLHVKNLSSCESPQFTIEDPIDGYANFVSARPGEDLSEEGFVKWGNILLAGNEEYLINMVWEVRDDLESLPPEIINGFGVKYATGKERYSNVVATFVGDGIRILLELKDYKEGDHHEATYDTNRAILYGKVLVNPPPENPQDFFNGLIIIPESKPTVVFDNGFGRAELVSRLLQRLSDENKASPLLKINPDDGSLELQDGSKDIPIKLLDENNTVTIRVRDQSGNEAEATVIAKSAFHKYLFESMDHLDKLKQRGVGVFYDAQVSLFEDWYVAFATASDLDEARRYTEAAYRMSLVEKFAYEASNLGWDIIDKSIEAEKDFLTIEDAYDVAGLFVFDKIAKSLGKTKPIKQGTEALMRRLTPIGHEVRDFLFDKIAIKAPGWVLMTDLAHTLATPLSEIAVKKTGEAISASVQYGFKKAALEKWIAELEKASIGAGLELFSHNKDFFLWALSYGLLSAQSDALSWRGEHDQARSNFQMAMGKIINIRESFTAHAINFDIKAAVWDALGDAGDVTSLIPAGWTQFVGKVETALGVVGRNATRGAQAVMTNSFMSFLLKIAQRGMDSIINSSWVLPPQDPTVVLEDTISPLVEQLRVAVENGNLSVMDTSLGSLAVEIEKFTSWEKEVRVKGSYALPQAGMEFKAIAKAYDRFLNAGFVANIDRAALTSWALAYELNPSNENKGGLLGAIDSVRDSQAELMAAAWEMVAFLNNSHLSSLAIITKIDLPTRLEVNNAFTITVSVKNIGEEVAQGVKLKMVLPEGFSSLENPEKNLGNLDPGSQTNVTYNVMATEYLLIPRGVIFYLKGESGEFTQHYEDTFVMLSTERASAEAIIGSSGGTLSTPGNEATLFVPASTVQADTKFILLPVSYIMNPGEGMKNVGGYFDLGALQAGNPVTSFSKPLQLTLRFRESDLNGVAKNTLQIWYLDESTSTWIPVPSLNIPNSNTVIGYTRHLSTFGLFPGTPLADSDGDGIPDWWEVQYDLNPYDPSDANADLDGDGLKNIAEYQWETDPTKMDTDGDGIPDGKEVEIGLDPKVANVNKLSPVINLTAFKTSSSSVSLTFTAPGYGGVGRASGYELRFSKEPITEENASSAMEAWGVQVPLPAGSVESITVRGLEGNTTYYFAIRSLDYTNTPSPLSNIVSAKTSGLLDWVRNPDAVITQGGTGAFDERLVHHPAVIFDKTDPNYPQGVYKMWYMGSTDTGAEERHRIGYAFSEDGINWTKVPGSGTGGSVIDLGVMNGFNESMINTPTVLKDETEPNPDARYKLWYYQFNGWGETDSNAIIYCTSPDGINWTKQAAVMHRCRYECVGGCKAGCEEGRFDWASAYFPSIMKDESEPNPSARYKMWYTGFKGGTEYGIGYAISPDGINWTRVNGPNPDGSVLTKGVLGTGEFDEKRVWTPSVVKLGETYIMFFSGVGPRSLSPEGPGVGGEVRTIGFATSKDGIHWKKIPSTGTGGCSLDLGASGKFDEDRVQTPSVIWDGSMFKMWYGGTSRDGRIRIGYAESRPGMEYLFTIQYAEKKEIGPEGGIVTITDEDSPILGASVEIPPGVLNVQVTITIGEFSEELPPMPAGVNGIGVPVHFGPDGMDFSPYEVTIGIPYRDEDLAAAGITDPDLLAVYVFDAVSEQWQKVGGQKTVDRMNRMIWIKVTHFSIYKLGSAPYTHTLTVSKIGAGRGTVTSIPTGIECGGTCAADFAENTVVTLTATPGPFSTFSRWSGDCSGTNPTTTVAMNANKTCTATFTAWKIILIAPDQGVTFTACSYYNLPLFRWDTTEVFKNLEIHFSSQNNFATLLKVRGKPELKELLMTIAVWEKVLLLPGPSGGKVYWRVVGTKADKTVVMSNVRSFTIEAPKAVGSPKIAPTSIAGLPTLSWNNNCNIKLKVWFGNNPDFTKKKALSFHLSNPNEYGGVFTRELTSGQWISIHKMVGSVPGSTIWWYVESWDVVKRYKKTSVMSFTLTK